MTLLSNQRSKLMYLHRNQIHLAQETVKRYGYQLMYYASGGCEFL